MLLVSDLLHVWLVAACLVRRVAHHVLTRLDAKHQLKKGLHSAPKRLTAKELREDGTYDPLFVDIVACREEIVRTNSPDTFVQHAKAQRRLPELESRWQMVFEGLPIAEKLRYHRAQGTKPPQPKGPSLFFDLMTAKSPEEKEAAMMRIAGGLTGDDGQPKTVYGTAQKLLSVLEMIVFWVAIHAVLGWNRSISGGLIYSFPVDFFWPFMSATPSFPMSMFAKPVKDEDILAFMRDEDYMTDNFVPPSDQHVTFGFFFTIFLIGYGTDTLRRELFRPEGSLRKSIQLIREMASPPKQKNF